MSETGFYDWKKTAYKALVAAGIAVGGVIVATLSVGPQTPLIAGVVFCASSIVDWLKHRNDEPDISTLFNPKTTAAPAPVTVATAPKVPTTRPVPAGKVKLDDGRTIELEAGASYTSKGVTYKAI